jgi:hypothetical protein
MANGILVQNKVHAKDTDALNRPVVSASAVQNGHVMAISNDGTNTNGAEVWTGVAPTTGNLSDLWMAYSPEVVITNGKYRGIDCDPREFTNIAGRVFDAFKPQVGDIMTLTADNLAGTKGANTFVVATNTAFALTWGAAAVSGLSLSLIEETTLSLGTGSIGSQKIVAYKFEVVAIA